MMAWATSASTAPPANAWGMIAVSASLLPMNALPAAAATTPASSTVDHSPKIAAGR